MTANRYRANQPTKAPTRKITAVSVAGAVVVLVGWLLDEFADVTLPDEVGAAIVTLIVAVATGYMVRD